MRENRFKRHREFALAYRIPAYIQVVLADLLVVRLSPDVVEHAMVLRRSHANVSCFSLPQVDKVKRALNAHLLVRRKSRERLSQILVREHTVATQQANIATFGHTHIIPSIAHSRVFLVEQKTPLNDPVNLDFSARVHLQRRNR